MDNLSKYESYIKKRAFDPLQRAKEYCNKVIEETRNVIDSYLVEHAIDKSKVCFIAVGSIGRGEALESSDIDLIPITANGTLEDFEPHDKPIRELLGERLKMHVSKGEDLTKMIQIKDLVNPASIGGDSDNSSQLTKRILVLTEGVQVGGELVLDSIKKDILTAYSQSPSTRGRHVLSLCNDVARYYRTLCIEFKAKVDVSNKDWCTRNVKLRHSRKVWYFSTILSIVSCSHENNLDTEEFKDSLLESFEETPVLRIFSSVNENQYDTVGSLVEYYSWFLQFMSHKENRKKLTDISHDERYDSKNEVFYSLKLNSDMLHLNVRSILQGLPESKRQKVIDWFLL